MIVDVCVHVHVDLDDIFGSTFLEMRACVLSLAHSVHNRNCMFVELVLHVQRLQKNIFENLKRRSKESAAGQEEARSTATRMANEE